MNKLVDEYNNTYQYCISKKPIDADYSALTEETETDPKAPKFKVGDGFRTNKYKNIFSKVYTKNWSKEVFDNVFVLKTSS